MFFGMARGLVIMDHYVFGRYSGNFIKKSIIALCCFTTIEHVRVEQFLLPVRQLCNEILIFS